MDQLTAPVAVVDELVDIQVNLTALGWAMRFHQCRETPAGLEPTGRAYWEIADNRSLWGALWTAVGEARARDLGAFLKEQPDRVKLYRLIEQLDAPEITALADALRVASNPEEPET